MLKKPEFWVAASALVIAGGGTLWNMKQISELRKMISTLDGALGVLVTKLGGTLQFPKLDMLLVEIQRIGELSEDFKKNTKATNRRIATLEKTNSTLVGVLEDLLEAMEKGGTDVRKIKRLLGTILTPEPTRGKAPPPEDEEEEEEDPMKGKGKAKKR